MKFVDSAYEMAEYAVAAMKAKQRAAPDAIRSIFVTIESENHRRGHAPPHSGYLPHEAGITLLPETPEIPLKIES